MAAAHAATGSATTRPWRGGRPAPLSPGLRVTGLTASGVIDGAMDGDSFLAYVAQILVPTLAPGDIVIADNLAAHHVDGIQPAIEAAVATLRYLPAYSPDLNPIGSFAKLKTLVRAARCRSIDTHWPLLGECVLVSPQPTRELDDDEKHFH